MQKGYSNKQARILLISKVMIMAMLFDVNLVWCHFMTSYHVIFNRPANLFQAKSRIDYLYNLFVFTLMKIDKVNTVPSHLIIICRSSRLETIKINAKKLRACNETWRNSNVHMYMRHQNCLSGRYKKGRRIYSTNSRRKSSSRYHNLSLENISSWKGWSFILLVWTTIDKFSILSKTSDLPLE